MAQPSSSPHESGPLELYADSDHQVLLFPTQFVACDQTDLPAGSAGRPVTRPQGRISARVIRQVPVLGVSGRLSDVVEDLDRSMQLALADEPPGVVCDLSGVLGDFGPVGVEVLATAGRHVRVWPGTPVGVACPDPQVREALSAHPLGAHLIVTPSLFSAVSAVLSTPTLTIARLRLAPHPTAPRASRNFVTRTLLDWQLNRVVPFASLVVSELVASSSINAGTELDLSMAWNRDALRLTVRDHGPWRPGHHPHSGSDLRGRGLTVVAGLSREFGALPTADGGKVVWAVLDAPRPPPTTSRHRRSRESRKVLTLNVAPEGAGQPSGRMIEKEQR